MTTIDANHDDRLAQTPTGYRWNEIAMQQTRRGVGPRATYRLMALLNAAIYDVTVAAQ